MEHERWRQIESIFQSALKLDPSRRGVYLDRACAGDEALRAEIESLLVSHGAAASFLESNAQESSTRGAGLADGVTEEASGPAAMAGKTIAHYRVLSPLGSGGMGVVYEGVDVRLGRRVALKFLSEKLANDPNAHDRFEREARAASSLNHPHICTVYEIEEHDARPVIVMELLEGESLKGRISAGPVSRDELLEIGIQAADALDAAHHKGITHRDIKPGNIFIVRGGLVKLLDFGLAKMVSRPEGEDLTGEGTLTTPGVLAGTPSYMSPEQARGETIDARSDLFSLGVVLYEMATGRQPFARKSTISTIDAVLNAHAPAPSSLNPSLPAPLDGVISTALEKNRSLRYQHAADLGNALKQLKQGTTAALPTTPSAPVAGVRSRADRRAKLAAMGVVAILAIAAGAYYFSRRAHPALTEKDSIVLADFTNKTADPLFDGALRQGLEVQLAQSPFLSLVSEEQVQEALRMMGQPADTPLTPAIARGACQRIGSVIEGLPAPVAVIDGSITNLGAQYVVGLKAVNCHTDESLADVQATAGGKEQVLNALGKAAAELRGKLGESLSAVQKFDTPLEQATTPSLEALQTYSLGIRAMTVRTDFAAAVTFFHRAIELDPKFASAYGNLAICYSNLGETGQTIESYRKAYEFRDRANESERFAIEFGYFYWATGDLEKARQTYELWAATYPRKPEPYGIGGQVYSTLGQYEKTLQPKLEALRLAPMLGITYGDVIAAYLPLNRFAEAAAVARRAEAMGFQSPYLSFDLYWLAFAQNDSAAMARQVAWAAGKPGAEDLLLALDSDTAAYSGHLAKARGLSDRAVASAEQAKENEAAASYEADGALREAFFGNADEARRRATAALRLSSARDIRYAAALALAVAARTAGEQAEPAKLADELSREFPDATVVQFNYLPTIRAQLALDRGEGAKAIEILQPAGPYELGEVGISLYLTCALYPVYVRGEAYLAAHHGGAAAREFQKIIGHRGAVFNEPIGALAHLGLARGYALAGESAKARAAYQDFLNQWKDADPGIPVLLEAQREYAALR